MQRSDQVTIGVLVVLGVVALSAIGVLTVMGSPEWIKFVIMMVLFVAILIGSYLFVVTPQKQRRERDSD